MNLLDLIAKRRAVPDVHAPWADRREALDALAIAVERLEKIEGPDLWAVASNQTRGVADTPAKVIEFMQRAAREALAKIREKLEASDA